MMTDKEKAAYIDGLKIAIDQIEVELDMVSMEYKDRPILLMAASGALMNASILISDQIAMTDGTRETKD